MQIEGLRIEEISGLGQEVTERDFHHKGTEDTEIGEAGIY
jgi:hypothetical protein